MDKPFFEDFIEQLLCHCGKWPEPETVLLMDNVRFHYSDKVKRMCTDANVKFDFTPPYTPRTDPIEEFFVEVKTYVKSQSKSY
jgi:transposase